MTDLMRAAAQERAAAYRSRSDRPQERRKGEAGRRTYAPATIELKRSEVEGEAQARAKTFERDGRQVVQIGGHASVTEHPYEMYDMFGPFTEIVSAGAFGKTLAQPDLLVEFTLNHNRGGGAAMAHTRNNTLDLLEDEVGLRYDAFGDPQRYDVHDLVLALERGDQSEASFKFRIEAGMWSPDYMEFRINEVDLHGGDVSSVNFGANPAATSALVAHSAATSHDLRVAKLKLAIAG